MDENRVSFPGSNPGVVAGDGVERRGLRRLRIGEVVGVAMVAVLVFQLLRSVWLERYRVTTGSMEPLLHGGATDGDMVLVDGLAWRAMPWRAAPEPRRFDLGVFAPSDEPGLDGVAAAANAPHLVKRIVAFGGEWVQTRGGDLWVGDAPQSLNRVVKDPRGMRDLRVPWSRWPRDPEGPFAVAAAGGGLGGLELVVTPGDVQGAALVGAWPWLPAAADLDTAVTALQRAPGSHALGGDGALEPLGYIWTASEIDTRALSRGELTGRSMGAVVDDIGLDLRFVPGPATADTAAAGIVCVHECREQLCVLRYAMDGTAKLLLPGGDSVDCRGPELVAGQPARLEFGYLDGRFFLLVQDSVVLEVERSLAAPKPGGPPGGEGVRGLDEPRNRLLFAWAGPGAAALNEVRAFRDLFYFVDPVPFTLPAPVAVPMGHYWVFGDNSTNSRDSRTRGGFSESALVGRPSAVLGPGLQVRWLAR